MKRCPNITCYREYLDRGADGLYRSPLGCTQAYWRDGVEHLAWCAQSRTTYGTLSPRKCVGCGLPEAQWPREQRLRVREDESGRLTVAGGWCAPSAAAGRPPYCPECLRNAERNAFAFPEVTVSRGGIIFGTKAMRGLEKAMEDQRTQAQRDLGEMISTNLRSILRPNR